MPASFIKGDLFAKGNLQALAHGCNCAGAMGRGIATEFRSRFPAMFAEYKRRCDDGRFHLGDVFMWRGEGTTVFNLGTQRTWRTKADMSAIEKAVRTMVSMAEECAIETIGLPRIGSGLGGLPWEPVRALLERVGASTDVQLVVFEEYVPRAL